MPTFSPTETALHQDGDLMPQRFFPDRAAFVARLAAQSDYSLSGIEKDDPWSRNNIGVQF